MLQVLNPVACAAAAHAVPRGERHAVLGLDRIPA
jgi:hypothetical protein